MGDKTRTISKKENEIKPLTKTSNSYSKLESSQSHNNLSKKLNQLCMNSVIKEAKNDLKNK